MELLPVRSFFAEALASLYVVSGQKVADQRARDLVADIPSSAGGTGPDGSTPGTGLSGDNRVETGAVAAGDAPELRSRRVRRFR